MNTAVDTVALEMSRESKAATKSVPRLRIYRLNEYDFWIAMGLEEAIEDAQKRFGLTRDNLLDDQFPAAALTDSDIENFNGGNLKGAPIDGWKLIEAWREGGEKFPCQLLVV